MQNFLFHKNVVTNSTKEARQLQRYSACGFSAN